VSILSAIGSDGEPVSKFWSYWK